MNEVELRNKKINYRIGCNTCQRNDGKYVFEDDMESKKIEETKAYQEAYDLGANIN